jgi:predicted transposase/invertase (TIGR01784 family)
MNTILQVSDLRQTKVYQEALDEGIKKGIEKGIEKVVRTMLKNGCTVDEIAKNTGLTVAQVRKIKTAIPS